MSDKFRDPVHGFVKISDLENEIVDTAPFQRLRNIKQLAMTYLVFHGAEHTRFGHSLGVMHLVTKAFRTAVANSEYTFSDEKKIWYEQILRLIALTHDLGHAPFSHASESLFPKGKEHEDYTEEIINNTVIANIINKIGSEFVEKYGSEYNITPSLICNIYRGRNPGENSEFTFLKSFMDSELDCDKMDYLLRDSLFCGVEYGKYDIDRLISSLTIYIQDGCPRLAIKNRGVQAFEEFVLARYFMFVQVYFHRTRRYFDIMLVKALKEILSSEGGTYPKDISEFIKWDDNRVVQKMKELSESNESCANIVNRIVYPCVNESKTHPQLADKRVFILIARELKEKYAKDGAVFLEDFSADKMPHKIPMKSEVTDEKAILIVNKQTEHITTISEESHIIQSLTNKIDIYRLYINPEFFEKVKTHLKTIYQAFK